MIGPEINWVKLWMACLARRGYSSISQREQREWIANTKVLLQNIFQTPDLVVCLRELLRAEPDVIKELIQSKKKLMDKIHNDTVKKILPSLQSIAKYVLLEQISKRQYHKIQDLFKLGIV